MISVIFLRILRICADLAVRFHGPALTGPKKPQFPHCAHLAAEPLGIAVSLHLILTALREGNAEHANHVVVRGLHIHMCFDERLPPLKAGFTEKHGHVVLYSILLAKGHSQVAS